MIPIIKSVLITLLGNYRLNSLLSNLNKIVEKVMYNRLYSFYLNKVLNNSQVGFRQNHSITLALSEFVVGVLSNFDKGNAVCAVFLN